MRALQDITNKSLSSDSVDNNFEFYDEFQSITISEISPPRQEDRRRTARNSLPARNVMNNTIQCKKQRLSLPCSFNQKTRKNLKRQCQFSELIMDVSNIDIKQQKESEISSKERLCQLLRLIKQGLPNRVYGSSNRNAGSFKRVETYILLFKTECLTQCRTLFNDSLWYELLDYITTVWSIVAQLPLWENTRHNTHREQCFAVMAAYCRKTMKVASLTQHLLVLFSQRFKECSRVHSSIKKLSEEVHTLISM